jgi:hypothetical protein
LCAKELEEEQDLEKRHSAREEAEEVVERMQKQELDSKNCANNRLEHE